MARIPPPKGGTPYPDAFRRYPALGLILLLAVWLTGFSLRAAGDPPPDGQAAVFAGRVERTYSAAKTRFAAHPDDAEAAWQFARACFDVADLPSSDARREGVAEEGINACRGLIQRQPDSAPGHYYLGMDLAELARTKTLGALKIVREMETEFTRAAKLDARLDYAGADRNLGVLYRDAPGWPISIGSKPEALQHMLKAVEIAPSYPENHLNLIESYLKWGDKDAARNELKALTKMWLAAKKELSGEFWESSWIDWEQRRKDCEAKLDGPR